MSTKTNTTEASTKTINSTANMQNLYSMMTKAGTFAVDSTRCILIEIATKFEALEITADNADEMLGSKEWKGLNTAYNTGRMKVFSSKLLNDSMKKAMALMVWNVDKKGIAYMDIGGVFRVTDASTNKGAAYKARYSNGYNSAMTVLRAWMQDDAEAAFAVLDSKDPDVTAYNEYRRAYQAAKAEQRKAEAKAQEAGEGAEERAPDLDDNASDSLRELYNKADSLKRLANAADSIIDGTEAYTLILASLDEHCRTLRDIIQAQPDEDEAEVSDDDMHERACEVAAKLEKANKAKAVKPEARKAG